MLRSHLRHQLARLLLILAAIVLPLLLAAPVEAGSYVARHHTWYVTVGAETPDHAIQGMAFLPRQIWIDAGDTVVWTVRSAEPHTVTFLRHGQSRPAFNASDPNQTMRRGGSSYNGSSYYNSGLLMGSMGSMGSMGYSSGGMSYSGSGHSYSLTFNVTGNFYYYCLVHTKMYGIVYVRHAGTSYPYTQADYSAQAAYGARSLIGHGEYLASVGERLSGGNVVTVGIGDGYAMALRYFPYTLWVHRGQTVWFVNRDSETPHTVTFGANRTNTFAPYGNRTNYTGGALNSGYIGAMPQWHGRTFSVTFTRDGTFTYHCALHASLGMYGRVIVYG